MDHFNLVLNLNKLTAKARMFKWKLVAVSKPKTAIFDTEFEFIASKVSSFKSLDYSVLSW